MTTCIITLHDGLAPIEPSTAADGSMGIAVGAVGLCFHDLWQEHHGSSHRS